MKVVDEIQMGWWGLVVKSQVYEGIRSAITIDRNVGTCV